MGVGLVAEQEYLNSAHLCLCFGLLMILPSLNFGLLSLVSVAQAPTSKTFFLPPFFFHMQSIFTLFHPNPKP
jgi:hypothetical protein